ncbi:MAG: hypothetical protein UT64_C0013G0010 [Candidatus Falkowbacteria bacterium GW2011_GWF2_39_8]|uniref:Metallopeptidase family protein n=1 Tax=Candidatus Falkowbacteria bacterium GW2011_GWF2_39_8 TaxID=1618642 RepID=A0A0G0PZ24_9BACT|nr:MAG: hypothetical protein UT64_C0013G0010 [Candidatus Falkowbacteria bacterium GW2011_GWF2_39_8]
MDREIFEKLVEEGIDLIPKKFLDKLDNVVIVVEDEANQYQLNKVNLPAGQVLFGLYEGVPLIRRNSAYGNVLPDKITIFQKPIEAYCASEEEIREKVRDTVWHEIAHHFGSDEHGAQRAGRNSNK